MDDKIMDLRKTEDKRKEYLRRYYKKYYANPENRHKNCASMRLNYWRKKYIAEFGGCKEDILTKSEFNLRDALMRGVKLGETK